MRIPALLALALLGGCQMIIGIESATLDETPDAALPDSGPPSVSVTVGNRRAWEGGSAVASWEIAPAAYYLEGGKYVTQKTPEPKSEAHLAVPIGDYFVRIEPDSMWAPYALTGARQVDLGEWEISRNGERFWAESGTRITLEGTGLAAGWGDRDSLSIGSTTLGINMDLWPGGWWSSRNASPAPTLGDTTVDVDFDWQGTPLPWGVEQDNLYLVVNSDQTVNGQTMRVVRAVAPMVLPPILPDQSVAVVAGGFSSPPTRTTQLDFRRSQFSALRTQINPNARVAMRALTLRAQPLEMAGENQSTYASQTLLWYDAPDDTDVDLGTIPFPNPYSASWIVVREVRYSFVVSTTFGGVMRDIDCQVQIAVDNDSTGPVTAPSLGPPRFPTLNDRGAFGDATGVGANPVLSWMPPSTGTPNRYRIRVYRYTTPDERTQLDLYVPGRTTSITIPPGVMQENAWHFFVIHAVTAGGDAETQPFLTRLPYASTPVITGKFAVGVAPF